MSFDFLNNDTTITYWASCWRHPVCVSPCLLLAAADFVVLGCSSPLCTRGVVTRPGRHQMPGTRSPLKRVMLVTSVTKQNLYHLIFNFQNIQFYENNYNLPNVFLTILYKNITYIKIVFFFYFRNRLLHIQEVYYQTSSENRGSRLLTRGYIIWVGGHSTFR